MEISVLLSNSWCCRSIAWFVFVAHEKALKNIANSRETLASQDRLPAVV
jgi:hypothetical protein